MSSVPPPPPGFVLDGQIPPPPKGFVLDAPVGPEQYREPQGFLETMGAMATGESEGLEAQGQGGLAGLGMVGTAMAGAAPGAAGLAARALQAGSGLYAWSKTGNPLAALGAFTLAGPAVLRPFGKYLEKIAKGRAATAQAKAAVEVAKKVAKQSSTTAPPMSSGATMTPQAPTTSVVPFPPRPTMPARVTAPQGPAPAAATAPQLTPVAESDDLTDVLQRSIEAAKKAKAAPKLVPAAGPPKPAGPPTPKAEAAPNFFKSHDEVQAAIVQMKTQHGFSRDQIVNVLKERGIRERGAATTMTDLVLKALKEGVIQ